MTVIEQIRTKFVRDEFEFSRHAADCTILRHISVQEVREAVQNGEVIEDYPDDKYGPSCLIFGFTQANRVLHIHCSHPTRAIVKVITVYEPNPDEWGEFRIRKE